MALEEAGSVECRAETERSARMGGLGVVGQAGEDLDDPC